MLLDLYLLFCYVKQTNLFLYSIHQLLFSFIFVQPNCQISNPPLSFSPFHSCYLTVTEYYSFSAIHSLLFLFTEKPCFNRLIGGRGVHYSPEFHKTKKMSL